MGGQSDGEISTENQTETDKRYKFPIVDNRESGDPVQVLLLSERLKEDRVDLGLEKTKQFLGKYSTTELDDISIKLMNGQVGEGQQVENGVIEIQLPQDEIAIAEIKASLGTALQTVSEAELDSKCREIINASCASTALHEGVHALTDSKPGSTFAQDLGRVSGLSNENGKMSTLLDEGIAYSVQGIYAPEIPPLGSFAPVAREGEKDEVIIRKNLGEALRPKVQEYLDAGKTIDDDFLSFAVQEMLKLEGNVLEVTPDLDKADRAKAEQYWHEKLGGETLISKQQDTNCEISVVVPVFDEGKSTIFRQLRSILNQRDIDPTQFEVIYVVNNDPQAGMDVREVNKSIVDLPIWKNHPTEVSKEIFSDEEVKLISQLRKLNLFVIDKSSQGNEIVDCNAPKARNRGVAEASKRFDDNAKDGIILQTDADTLYDDNTFFQRIKTKFKDNPDMVAIPGGMKFAYITNETDQVKREVEVKKVLQVIDYMGWLSLRQILLGQPWGLDDVTMSPANAISRSFESTAIQGMQDQSHMDDNTFGPRLKDYSESHDRIYSYSGANIDFPVETIIRQTGGITASLEVSENSDKDKDPFLPSDHPDKDKMFPIKDLYNKYRELALQKNNEAVTRLEKTISNIDIIFEEKPQGSGINLKS